MHNELHDVRFEADGDAAGASAGAAVGGGIGVAWWADDHFATGSEDGWNVALFPIEIVCGAIAGGTLGYVLAKDDHQPEPDQKQTADSSAKPN